MKRTLLKFFYFSVMLFCSNASANECAFIDDIKALVSVGPGKALREKRFGDPAPFLSVADGIGPSRPGIGEDDEAACVMDKYTFHMIWAGADVISCEAQFKNAARANRFAKNYNQLLRNELSSKNIYKCTEKHLADERRARCAATGQELCTGLENWGGAHSELTRLVWDLNGTSTIGYRPEEYGKFWVSIRDPEHRDEIERSACNIFPKYGVKMNVNIYIELANFNRRTQEWDKKKLKSVLCSY